jgi:hypothetical protein
MRDCNSMIPRVTVELLYTACIMSPVHIEQRALGIHKEELGQSEGNKACLALDAFAEIYILPLGNYSRAATETSLGSTTAANAVSRIASACSISALDTVNGGAILKMLQALGRADT